MDSTQEDEEPFLDTVAPHSTPMKGEEEELVSERVFVEESVQQTNTRRKKIVVLSETNPLRIRVRDSLLPKIQQGLFILETTAEDVLGRLDKFQQGHASFWHTRISPHNPHALVSILVGLILVFFGRQFIITFTIIEAFRHGGSDTFIDNIGLLGEQVKRILEANKDDNLVDEDGNGIPDVQQLSRGALIKRKFRVAFRAINPSVVQNAMQALWTSLVSASAAVKVAAARLVALGISLGNDLDRFAQRFVVPVLVDISDDSLQKWFPISTTYVCRFLGLTFAVVAYESIPFITTAVRGAFLFTTGLQDYLETRGVQLFNQKRDLDLLLVVSLMTLGVLVQTWVGHDHASVPTFIKAVFFPFYLLEWTLELIVSVVKSDAEKFQRAIGSE